MKPITWLTKLAVAPFAATAVFASALLASGCAGNYTAPAGPRAPDTPVERKVNLRIQDSLAAACGITVPHVFFKTDSDKLDDSFKETLREVATCAETGALKEGRVVLVGHADQRGDADYNRKLARERAARVSWFLTEQGVERDRIIIVSRGEDTARSTLGADFDRRVDLLWIVD